MYWLGDHNFLNDLQVNKYIGSRPLHRYMVYRYTGQLASISEQVWPSLPIWYYFWYFFLQERAQKCMKYTLICVYRFNLFHDHVCLWRRQSSSALVHMPRLLVFPSCWRYFWNTNYRSPPSGDLVKYFQTWLFMWGILNYQSQTCAYINHHLQLFFSPTSTILHWSLTRVCSVLLGYQHIWVGMNYCFDEKHIAYIHNFMIHLYKYWKGNKM